MKNILIFLLFFISVFGSANDCSAQLSKYIHRTDSLFQPSEKINYSVFAKGSKNEIESTFSTSFIFYKTFISSQDIDACVFHPSCSVYAIECIHHEKSKFIAFLKISDRLMRCHPLVTKGSYITDPKTGKYFDPIEN
jgi:putative component of membrane protein insertase Oxa1/YidC/SpoIIIJ protein YidD